MAVALFKLSTQNVSKTHNNRALSLCPGSHARGVEISPQVLHPLCIYVDLHMPCMLMVNGYWQAILF